MWLLPIFSLVANTAARIFYRVRVAGPRAPRRGPLLLVANHPNALLDPALVAAAARRPVRFLAKAPLFDDRLVGWLVRGAGAIPVYRKSDDPSMMGRNEEMFRAGHDALASGAAIGLFPEGMSHSDPEIKRLKTGAARLALGASARLETDFPIVPMGLVLRQKDRFRSPACVVLGSPVEWKDLVPSRQVTDNDAALRSGADRDAVSRLTERIDDALRLVTVNMDRWEDEPLLHCAEGIWQAEGMIAESADGNDATASPDREEERVRRLGVASRLLAQWRQRPDEQDGALVQDLVRHQQRLDRLALTPQLLVSDRGLRTALRWSLSRLYLLGVPALLLAIAGYIVYLAPFQLTARITALAKPTKEEVATYKVLIGAVIYGAWVIGLSIGASLYVASRSDLGAGLRFGVLAILLLPWLGMAGLWIREHWRGTGRDLRQFFFLRSRRQLVDRLRHRQRELATRIAALVERAASSGTGIGISRDTPQPDVTSVSATSRPANLELE